MNRPMPDFGTYAIDGKFYMFKYKPDLSTDQLDKISPILKNDELSVYSGVPGPVVYTWIIGKNDSGEEVLYAREAKDKLELFSKHMVIDYEVSCKNDKRNPDFADPCIDEVVYAGEMTIDYTREPLGTFNTLSGTYMAERDPAKVFIGEEVRIAQTLNELSGIPFTFVGNGATMIVTRPNLRDVYDSGVVDIYEFDTEKDVTELKQLPLKMSRIIPKIDQQIAQDTRLYERLKTATPMSESNQVTELKTQLAEMQARYLELSSKPPLIMESVKRRRVSGGRKSSRKTRRKRQSRGKSKRNRR